VDEEESEMSEWKPIDTAPKDGSWFLGYFPNQTVHAIPCHYGKRLATHVEGEPFYGMFGVGEIYGDKCILWPTHWMPLPSPPEK